ncbi:MAG: glycosyltransferase [Nanoarchaeota archaeon]|nr:glycosyltransferase [Nanoarchaeota archaeon]
MKILQISPPVLPIGPDMKYGGIERVIRDLDKEFLNQGHESFVVASPDSIIDGTLISSPGESSWQKDKDGFYAKCNPEFEARYVKTVIEAIMAVEPDVIHDHLQLIMRERYLESKIRTPMLTTLHGTLHSRSGQSSIPVPTPKVVNEWNHFNAISESQRRFFSELIPVQFCVPNGINVNEYPFEANKRNYLLSLGKIGENKGQDTAIEVSYRTNKPLVIAGPVHIFRKDIKEYWESISKRIDVFYDNMPADQIDDFTQELSKIRKHKVIYVGETDDKQKKEWFKYAETFLMPIRWHEPFGLVMIESMATGTPVVAYNMGAVSEIVVNQRTGFIIPEKNLNMFVKETIDSKSIDPHACRRHVERDFDVGLQARRYINIFDEIRQH